MMRALVIEDDAAINDVVCRKLRKSGFEVTAAYSGTEARMVLEGSTFDIVITDLMLPGLPGEELVALIREHDALTPIIVISAKTATSDKVALLKGGADDYLVKPFDLDELMARVEAALRRAGRIQGATGSDAIEYDLLRISSAARTVTAAGHDVTLTKTEFDMLALMAARPGRVFTKQELYESAWGEPYMAQESTVSAHISNLRSKLKPFGADGLIQTVWGIGFKLS